MSLITATNQHSRQPGQDNYPTPNPLKDPCSHCKLNRYNFTNHTKDNCADWLYWKQHFGGGAGGGPAPSNSTQSQSNPTTNKKLQAQTAQTLTLLNKIGHHQIPIKSVTSANPFGPLQSVCEVVLDTQFDENNN